MVRMKWLILVAIVCVISAGCSSTSFVKTRPSEAKIYVDGKYIGESPCGITGSSLSSITIVAEKPGYKTASKMISVNQVSSKTGLGCLACGIVGAAASMELPPEIEIVLEKEEK